MTIVAETVQIRNGTEYVTVTGLDTGTPPLLQMCDYTLKAEELAHKGKLVGKKIKLQIESVRALFSGRPQLSAKLLDVGK